MVVTEAKIRQMIEAGIQAAIPGIVAAMQPSQQVTTVADEHDEISMDPCYQEAIASKKAVLRRIAKGERSRTIFRNSKGGGHITDNNLKDLDTCNRELKSMRSGNHTQYMH